MRLIIIFDNNDVHKFLVEKAQYFSIQNSGKGSEICSII